MVLFRLALLLSLALATALLLTPADALSSLRAQYAWFGWGFQSIGALSSSMDLHHGVLFAELGMLARLAYPRAGAVKVLLSLAVFAVATELAQFFAPGRQPQGSDALMDLVGALLGYGLAALLCWRRAATVRR